MVKHDPTKQKHGMYESLNEKGASHDTSHKDLNAKAPEELNRFPIGYSSVIDKTNAKSPVQIHQIDGYKSHHGNLEKKPEGSHTFHQTDSDFPISQIPNTSPKFREEDSLRVDKKELHHKSKSMIFHA